MLTLIDTLIVVGMAVAQTGTIHEADGPYRHTFRLCNGGTEAVSLVQGYTSCHCTTILFDKDQPIAPGDTVDVTLVFNPQGKGGDFYESATLQYSTIEERTPENISRTPAPSHPRTPENITLALEGTCITSEETLLRQYPVRVSDDIRLNTNRFDIGILHPGDTVKRTVAVLHRDDGDHRELFPSAIPSAPTVPRVCSTLHVPSASRRRVVSSAPPSPSTSLSGKESFFVHLTLIIGKES